MRAGSWGMALLLSAGSAWAAKPLWTRTVSPEAGPKAMGLGGGSVVVVTWDNAVVALDAAKGTQRWKAASPAPDDVQATGLAVVDDTVGVLWTGKAEVEGRDAASGAVRWTAPLEAPGTSLADCPGYQLMVATARGIGPDGQKTLMAVGLGPDGAPRWRAPVPGDLVGAGGGYVFAEQRSGVGRLKSNLVAVRCSDGASFALPAGPKRHVDFLDAEDGKVVTAHFDSGGGSGPLCITVIEKGVQGCMDAADLGARPGWVIQGATKRGPLLLVSTGHIEAYNLNDTPDSKVLLYDLGAEKPRALSEPMTASMGVVDAGQQWVAAFGTTGADDTLSLLDEYSLETKAKVALKKAPRVLAADAERAYVGSYDGAVTAVKLVAPGREATPRAKVAVAASAQVAAVAAPGLGWAATRVIDAHPKTGRTSGQKAPGTVAGLAFLGNDRLVAGGNDDRVRVFSVADGGRLYQSKGLGKDVDGLEGCADGTFAARIYGGAVQVFRAQGATWKPGAKVKHDGGWMFGLSGDCGVVVADDFGGTFTYYDAKSGRSLLNFDSQGRMDRRGLRARGGKLLVQQGPALALHDVGETREGSPALETKGVALEAEGGALVQAWPAGDGVLLEYCGTAACTVVLGERRVTFDTTGGVWSASVPSMIDLSPDGRWLVWGRDGLDLQLVDLQGGGRQSLGVVPRTMSATPTARFSPDGKTLAVAMQPEPWQVTLYRRGE